jgi:GNAT superfamily N-acetyltransferase
VGSTPDFVWNVLEGDDQIPEFMDAVVALYQGVMSRLPEDDRPFFFDYWLRLFNLASTHLFTVDGVPHAILTQPHRPGSHQFRWETASLACSDEFRGRLVLPPGVDPDQSFRMPVIDGGDEIVSPLRGTRAVENQRGYVLSLREPPLETQPAAHWRISRIESGDVEEAIDLLKRCHADAGNSEPDLAGAREELRRSIDHDAGWCWVARHPDGPSLCGIACYIGMHLPDAGVPAILISDLAVEPRRQKQGLARVLQAHAFQRLRDRGHRWVFGNIDPENHASRSQAERLGRTVWYHCLRFRSTDDPESRVNR